MGTIRYTSNNGLTWYKPDSVTTNDLYSVIMLDSQTGCIFGTSVYIFKTINGGKNWRVISSGITDNIITAVISSTNKIIIATSVGKLLFFHGFR